MVPDGISFLAYSICLGLKRLCCFVRFFIVDHPENFGSVFLIFLLSYLSTEYSSFVLEFF
jgi:hypothetical protein